MKNEVPMSKVKVFLKTKLSTDERWAKKALIEIFNKQTETEKETDSTCVYNEIGFSGVDANFMSSLSKQLIEKNYLTPKQMVFVFKKIPKYWKQIYEISDKAKLIPMIKEVN